MIPYFLCMCLLLTLSGGVCSKIPVFKGMSIPLFTNVTGENPTLYKNGNDNSTYIAMWKIEDEKITVKYNGNDKIFMDMYKNVWICRIDQNDQGKYFIMYGLNVKGPTVYLIILENSREEKQLRECVSSNFTEEYIGIFLRINEGDAINGVIGLNTTVTCSTTGATSVIWRAPNRTMINPALAAYKYSIRFNNITGSSTLTIISIEPSDSGLFTCIAANRFGQSLSDSILLSTVTPFVTINEGDAINGVIGLNATVTCSTCGATGVTWLAPNGGQINDTLEASKYSINFNNITGSSTLTIISIETSDNGSYTCIGANSLGLTLHDSIQLSAVNCLESDCGMKVNFMSLIFGAVGLTAGMIIIILICCIRKCIKKPDGTELRNRGKFTGKPDGMKLKIRGGHHTGVLDSTGDQETNLQGRQGLLDPELFTPRKDPSPISAMEESEERESDLLLPARQAADQSSARQQQRDACTATR